MTTEDNKNTAHIMTMFHGLSGRSQIRKIPLKPAQWNVRLASVEDLKASDEEIVEKLSGTYSGEDIQTFLALVKKTVMPSDVAEKKNCSQAKVINQFNKMAKTVREELLA